MKSLKDMLMEGLIHESVEDKIVKTAEKAFRTLMNKTKSIPDEIDPLIKQNFDVVNDRLNHTEGLIYCTIEDGGKKYTLCLDDEDDWNVSKETFNLKKVICVSGDCEADGKEGDAVIDAMYAALGY